MTTTTKRRIRTSENYDFTLESDPENYEGQVSMTVPDQALSVQEILRRFAAGQPINYSSNLHYTGDLDLPDVRTLDLSEIHEMSEANKADIKNMSEKLKRPKEQAPEQPAPGASASDAGATPSAG